MNGAPRTLLTPYSLFTLSEISCLMAKVRTHSLCTVTYFFLFLFIFGWHALLTNLNRDTPLTLLIDYVQEVTQFIYCPHSFCRFSNIVVKSALLHCAHSGYLVYRTKPQRQVAETPIKLPHTTPVLFLPRVLHLSVI